MSVRSELSGLTTIEPVTFKEPVNSCLSSGESPNNEEPLIADCVKCVTDEEIISEDPVTGKKTIYYRAALMMDFFTSTKAKADE